MITSTKVLARVSAIWTDDGLLENKWSNLIGSWCVSYYRKYSTAPREKIESAYERWALRTKNEALSELVANYLATLSDAYEQQEEELNHELLIEQASSYFNFVRLKQVQATIDEALEVGDTEKAEQCIKSTQTIDITASRGVRVLSDKEAIKDAFDERVSTLIQWEGALANFFQSSFERDSFLAFMAPEKRGKTWWLMEVAWQGMLQKRNVAFFSVGDLSQRQQMRRFMIRANERPIRPKRCNVPVELRIEETKKGTRPVVEHKPMKWRHPLEARAAWDACRAKYKGFDKYLRLSVHPNDTINVDGITNILQNWEDQDDWKADVVVIDYADILAAPLGYASQDRREQTNATWKQLRRLSQELHGCVVTATQTDAASYSASLLNRENFSEDKRKYAHVTGMIGINMTDFEKRLGVTRLNWVVLRELDFDVSVPVYVAGCLDVGQPAMLSTFS